MEANGSAEKLVSVYNITLRHIPEDRNRHGHCREKCILRIRGLNAISYFDSLALGPIQLLIQWIPGTNYPGSKATRVWHYLPPCNVKAKNGGAIIPLTLTCAWYVA
jgi:hypothetical protein